VNWRINEWRNIEGGPVVRTISPQVAICTFKTFNKISSQQSSNIHLSGIPSKDSANCRPLIGRDEFYLTSKETISFVKRDMNINGGI